MDTVITLIGEGTRTQDSRGVWHLTETRRDVYARVTSVTQTEFFEAGRNGLNPDYEMTMFRWDYNGEKTVEFNGLRYGVYRNYIDENSDEIELYVQRKGGTND